MLSLLISDRLRRLRRFPFSWWLAVLAVALFVGFVVSTSVSKATAAAARYDGATSIYVAVHTMKAGDVIDTNDVSQQNRPRAFVPKNALTESPVGRTVDVAIEANDVVTRSNTGASGLSPTASLLHTGEQGVAVPINDGSPTFQVGDSVSVIATANASDPNTTEPAVVVTNSARVINVSEHAVTIAVSSADAPRVAYAEAKSAVALAITAP